jgi:Flp pilus assembly protein CpaB
MRRGGRILILLGVILGIITAGGTFLVLGNATPTQNIPTRPIVVVLQPIQERVEIKPEQVGLRDWPEGSIPQDAFEKPEDVIGKVAFQRIYPGQLIVKPMLYDPKTSSGTRTNAAYLIPEGKVAVSLSASGVAAVSGAPQVGDYVDILLTLDPGGIITRTATTATTAPRTTAVAPVIGTEGQPVTQLMLQDVLIIQVGTWGAAEGKTTTGEYTFVLDRQDALALKSAYEQGEIALALRRVNDHTAYKTEPVTLFYLNKRFNFNLLPTPGQ